MEAIQINRKQLCFCSALSTLTPCFIRRCCPQSRAFSFICLTNRNAAGFQELLEDGFWPAKIIVQQIAAMERNEHPVLCRLGLMANKPFSQSEPTALSCCGEGPHCESGMQHLPGDVLGQQLLGINPANPVPFAAGTGIPTSRVRGAFPESQGTAVGKYKFLSLCINCIILLLLGPSSKKHLGRDFAMPVACRGPQ